MRGRSGDSAIGLGAQPNNHGPMRVARQRLLPTKHGHAARCRSLGATREYQSDSSSRFRLVLLPDHPPDHRETNEDPSDTPLTTVVPYQSDFALNSLMVFVVALL